MDDNFEKIDELDINQIDEEENVEEDKKDTSKEDDNVENNENEEKNNIDIKQTAGIMAELLNNMNNMPQFQKVEKIEEAVLLPNEIGRVKNVTAENVLIRITSKVLFESNLIDHHVVFEYGTNKLVGTLIGMNNDEATVRLLGEIANGRFVAGVLNKPALDSVCFIATEDEKRLILASFNINAGEKRILIGNMPLHDNAPMYVPINTFFSNHFAIFGNTGSGKSCGVARIFQNVFFNQQMPPKNACVFIFDAYGEYESALSIQNSQIFFKKYSTNVRTSKDTLIKLPLWFLDIDDIALLLDVDDQNQLPIIEKTLRLVTVFAGVDEDTRAYKNDIIARAILEVLYSGGSASQIHDQIFAILTSFNTPDLNLESLIEQPGYTRTFRQCMIIDKEGKIGEIQLVSEFIKKFINDNLKLELPDGTIPYTLENLREALDFALISEGILKSDKIYDKSNALKVRLDSLIKGEYAEYFKLDKYVDRNTFIKELITASNGARAQIVNVNISYLDDRLAKTICKIYAKLLFDFTSKLQNRGSFPVHIILEEAHRYVQNDSDVKILGYNIFERIAKEGRKYGVLLGLISQRPSELSETVLSQCSNFLIFKIQHPYDVSFIKQMVPYITDDIIEKMKSLQPGTCVSFGSAFKLPVIIKLDMPNPQPMSQNVDVSNIWY